MFVTYIVIHTFPVKKSSLVNTIIMRLLKFLAWGSDETVALCDCNQKVLTFFRVVMAKLFFAY